MSEFRPRDAQEEVLKYTGGLSGISAVPGSGKTMTIAAVAARLIARGVPEEGQVLVVTYQNAAVENVRARIASQLGSQDLPRRGYDVRTLHSLAYDIIHDNPGLAGTTSDFNVLDERARDALLEGAVRIWNDRNRPLWESLLPEGRGAEYWRRRWPEIARGVARTVITTAKNQRLNAAMLWENIRADSTASGDLLLCMGAEIYRTYQQQAETIGGLDFDDLVRMTVDLLEHHPDVTARLHRRWPYVLEDEAQDSMPLQEELLGLLVGEDGNWMRVGDPNQAIMSTFTAADPKYLRRFLEQEEVWALTLPESGRSAPRIIDLANHLVTWACEEHPLAEIRRGAFRPQAIEPTGPDDPQQNPSDEESHIAFRVYEGREEELRDVARRAGGFADTHPDQRLSVLVPTNNIGYRMAEHLRERDADFDEFLRSTASSRQVAETLGGILRYLADPLKPDHLEGAYRAIREVRSDELDGDDPERVAVLLRSCYHPEALLFPQPGARAEEALPKVPGVRTDDIDAAKTLAQHLRRYLRATPLPIEQLVMAVAQDLFTDTELATAQKIAAYLRGRAEQNLDWRLPDLARELDQVARGRFIGLADEDYGFAPRPGTVTLTTMHRAKGLEWDLVYLVGVDGTWFPHTLEDDFMGEYDFLGGDPAEQARSSLLSLAGEKGVRGRSATEVAHIEIISERLRLLYVGITRARRYLSISWSREVAMGINPRPVSPAPVYQELRRYYRARCRDES